MTRPAALDEMVDGKGGLRPHWRSLIGAFSALDDGGLQGRAIRLDRAFEEEGVTAVLPGASAAAHAWRCDPVPLPIPAAEFAALETGLAQRARLMEAILDDLYGAQALLADGTLPPALAFANPAFLRAGRFFETPSRLQFYAADLLRGPDGAWRVLADRTAGSSGVGFARENRRMMARVMPEAFHPVQVRQLRPFFDIWQDSLRRMAPKANGRPERPNPTVALLTPGTGHPLWFEHMYLSRELSCALVEGGDLTVRGGAVFLKTLRGLQQVDVLLRRIDGRMIDPLELEPGSLLGVPGLIDAARTGAVRISNDPGSGAVEAPALSAFLPSLCTRLLDERLQLQSVPTMWLGEARARALVQQDPDRWLIRPAMDGSVQAVEPSSLPPAERAALLARIEARPWDWAASAHIQPSMAPCLEADGLQPRPVVMRLYLVHDGVRWQALQGGLARVMEDSDRLAGHLPSFGRSKDVWVLNEERGDIVGPPMMPVSRLAIRRTTGDLPSRVADNLYWLGRYVERLERSARLVRAALARLSRGTALLPREISELQSLARCLAEAGCVPPEAASIAATTTLSDALLASVREGGAIHGRFASVSRLTESVRDRLTGDMYATFTQALRTARADCAQAGHSLDGLSHGMVSIMRYSTAVAGVAAENMVRGGGWLFLDLGRRVERAQEVASEVAMAIDQNPARIETGLRLVLELCDSAITYRARYLNVLQPATVLDLVLADQSNPRGLAFQLVAMHGLLDELTANGPGRELLAGAAAGLLAELEALVEGVVTAEDQAAAAAALPPRLHALSEGVGALSDRLTRRYFALLPVAQTLGLSADGAETGIVLRGVA